MLVLSARSLAILILNFVSADRLRLELLYVAEHDLLQNLNLLRVNSIEQFKQFDSRGYIVFAASAQLR